MKIFVLCLSLILSFSSFAQANLTQIVLNNPLQVKNKHILEVANSAIASSVYWEDEGYEFKVLEKSSDIQIIAIFQDRNKVTQKLKLRGAVRVGGFGWHEGYKKGIAYCTIFLFKQNGKYTDSSADADCDIELDWRM